MKEGDSRTHNSEYICILLARHWDRCYRAVIQNVTASKFVSHFSAEYCNVLFCS